MRHVAVAALSAFLLAPAAPGLLGAQSLPEETLGLVRSLDYINPAQQGMILGLLAEDIRDLDLAISPLLADMFAMRALNLDTVERMRTALRQVAALSGAETGPGLSRESYEAAVLALLRAGEPLIASGYALAGPLRQYDQALRSLERGAAGLGLPGPDALIADSRGGAGGAVAAARSEAGEAAAALAPLSAERGEKFQRKQRQALVDKLAGALVSPLPLGDYVQSNLVWTRDMLDTGSEALDLISGAMRTGRVDQARLRAIEEKVESLRKGPWSGQAARDAVRSACDRVPGLSGICDSVFDLSKPGREDLPAVCRPIDCKCDQIEAGILNRAWIPECKRSEAEILERCIKTEVLSGTCIPAGPGAVPG